MILSSIAQRFDLTGLDRSRIIPPQMTFRAFSRNPFIFLLLTATALWRMPLRRVGTAAAFAQMIGVAPKADSAADEDTDKMVALFSKLSEQLTAQELSLRKISCEEQVILDRASSPSAVPKQISQKFRIQGELKQEGSFSTDTRFVETHSPLNAASGGDGPIDSEFLVTDSLSAASEFLGLKHSESYSQGNFRKEQFDGRAAIAVSFQTVKQIELRKIIIGGKAVPMRILGTVWLDPQIGALLRMEVRQIKLPKDVRAYSYDVRYSPPTPENSRMTLPVTVRFTRILKEETLITTQTFSNCKIN